ncbi:MAG: Adenylate kinase (EC [uncultured Sulfurovum sp.]|uniref:Adenylate kinase n=1 Tax=uncultured Sulfurovum sp. TaxID=269237 RepID=A0A6S6UAQ1_9BACT|nr:MAG: Adenylate kinase (EC [uncultured Sulfurovum sp.]
MNKKLFLLIGAPGSGKTTDAKIIASRHKENISHYSTGDILREEVESQSELGKRIASYIQEGELVPLNIIMDTVLKAIKNASTEVILIDGYPRSVEQMIEFDKVLAQEDNVKLVSVIEVHVSEEVARERILGRVAKSNVVRSDDNMEVFKNRMEVYLKPLTEIQKFYKKKRVLKTFDGEKSIDIIISKMELFILTRL